MNWRDIHKEKPKDGQECLTKMKHGIISGCYRAVEGVFEAYYWHDMQWYSNKWVPIEEAE